MKTTVFMKVLKEVQNTELNPQLPIDGEQQSLCFTRLFRYAEQIAESSPFNVALPYKLWHALSTNNTQATAAYLEKYRSSYPAEFLQSYLINYLLVWERREVVI